MKRILIIVNSAFILILLINFFYYRNLYRQQTNYIVELLDRQVQIVGLEVDSINYAFTSDLNQIIFNTKDPSKFFDKSRPEIKYTISEQMKLFYSKYRDFVTKIRLYDNNFNEYTLSKDESKNEWIEGEFISLDQRHIEPKEILIKTNNEFNYYSVFFVNGRPAGNIAVTVDYKRYFSKLFSKYNLKDYQWQWVLAEDGEIIYDNNENFPVYSEINKIISDLQQGIVANMVHSATVGGKKLEVLSSYFSTQLLLRDLGIVFSAPTVFFQKYIIRNSLLIVTITLILIQVIIFVFWRYLKKQEQSIKELTESEKVLKQLISQMPVGVIIYNKKREILEANRIAAEYYSYTVDDEMIGKIFPETTFNGENDYFSKYLAGKFSPEQFIVIRKAADEIILFRSSIPVSYHGQEATLDILIDVTMFETARKQEEKANLAKT